MVVSGWHACGLVMLAGVGLALPGCGKKGPALIPVSGVVALDGKPLPNVAVWLEQQKGMNPGTGTSDEAGRFEIATHKLGKGVTPGQHRVLVHSGVSESPSKTTWMAPKEYASFDTSGLSVEVTPKQNTITLELSSQGPAAKK
jgi:predicted small lipoprotein YifL